MMVGYDHAVRDSDGSLIQFDYGEDAMDVGRVRFLSKPQLPFLADNAHSVLVRGFQLQKDRQ